MTLLKKYTVFVLLLATFWACSGEDRRKGDDYFQQEKYEEAIEAYSETLSLQPSNVNALYGRARAKMEMGNYATAIEDYKEALTYDDRNVKVLIGLGDVYYSQKNFDSALLYYEKATNFAPTNAYALFKEGRAHHKLGNVEEAMALYNDALREDKTLGDAYLYRGALQISQNNTRSACSDFRSAQSLGVSGAEEALSDYCR